MNIERKDQWKDNYKQLELKYETLKKQLGEKEANLKVISMDNATLKGKLNDALKGNTQLKKVVAKLKKAQNLFMDWARQQEWELPKHIRDELPQDRSFMRKSAFDRIPYGRSPAEYTFNILYFLSLPENEQVELGAKVFHHEKVTRLEDFAALELVTKELHDLLFYFPDDQVDMKADYAFQAACVPRYSTDPGSEWVILKKLALNLFHVYTRVTVRRLKRGRTYHNLRSTRRNTDKEYAEKLYLEAEKKISNDKHGRLQCPKPYKIKTKFDPDTGRFSLVEDLRHNWEIVNYGMVNYHGHYRVTNLFMDNNPPYRDGMKGIVQILWTGTCIYDSAED